MARTELPNGIILPAEYSDDWYDDMTSNLSKLDDVIGSDADKLSAENVGAAALSNDYADLDNKPTIPTKTSDLTNDSNFVDTSNSAVSSGITSAKVTDYDTHIADTDIHVTTSDKTTWNTVTSKAQDSNVVHKSGDETVGGSKTFSDLQIIGYGTQYKGARDAYILPEFAAGYSGLSITTLGFAQNLKIGNFVLDANNKPSLDTSKAYIQIATGENNGVNACILEARNSTSSSLGTASNKWSKIYGTEYYYGSNNVEFSTKFVTTDTNQTIGGTKDFSDVLRIYNSNASSNTPQLWLKNSKVNRGQSVYGDQAVWFRDATDKPVTALVSRVTATGASALLLYVYNVDQDNQQVANYLSFVKNLDGSCYLLPDQNNVVELGSTSIRLKDLYTNKINGVEPSSLSLPSDRSARVDISSYITNLGNGDNNQYIVPANGYIWLHFTSINSALCYSQTSGGLTNYAQTFVRYQGDGQLYAFFPVRKNDYFIVQIYTASTAVVQNAYFIPCQGNV